jgi:hypothetical protein
MQRFETLYDFATSTMDEPMAASFEGPAGRVNVSVQAQAGKYLLFGKPRNNSRDAQEAFEASLRDLFREPGAQFGITPARGFRFKEAKIGWLKFAYIVAFAALGYEYVLSAPLQPIRDQIAAPDFDDA